jgi:hypothetical protein
MYSICRVSLPRRFTLPKHFDVLANGWRLLARAAFVVALEKFIPFALTLALPFLLALALALPFPLAQAVAYAFAFPFALGPRTERLRPSAGPEPRSRALGLRRLRALRARSKLSKRSLLAILEQFYA